MRPLVASVAVSLTLPLLVAATGTSAAPPGARAGADCDPFMDRTYAGDVPSPQEVIGFRLGKREVTVKQSDRYLLAVDRASDRVSSGVMATSQQGRPLRYAVVGHPADVRQAKEAAKVLRDPATAPAVAARVADNAPAIAWVAANVHGDEESGTDASLRVLRDLADRTDCATRAIRRNTVVVVVPIQNPDGRVLDFRRNVYGFDLNRDWFARTQPETDGKVQLLRRYPAVLFIDDHEMGSRGFFFPPNADPVYHEVADRSVRWINDLYGAAMQREFDERDIRYFNYDVYDLFAMNYGDTVPTTGFLGAGMTFEKNNADKIQRRVREQYIAIWTSLSALAHRKDGVLRGWAASHRQAYRQGRKGILERNRVWAPGNEVTHQVPDEKVRHYFIETGRPGKHAEVRALVRRLQRMDVHVRRLTAPLRVPDYTPYGRQARERRLPEGTYWIPMAQAQKHWVQAMMNEDTYPPFPYFYDITAWSSPLLFNVPGGRSGARLEPRSTPVGRVAEPEAPRAPANRRVGMWKLGKGLEAWEASGWMRWLFDDKWQVDYTQLSTTKITPRQLRRLDVLVAPNGVAKTAYERLRADGRRALRSWIRDGGRLVTMRGSTELAARLGLTSARLRAPESDIPGSLIRAKVARGPLRSGVGETVWSFFEYDRVMVLPDESDVAVRYPRMDSKAWFISGFARGERELQSTAAVADERYGEGRVVLFAAEPNFRGFTDGTQQILWNAMYGRGPRGHRTASTPAQRENAVVASRRIVQLGGKLIVTVRTAAAASTRAVLEQHGMDPGVQRMGPGLSRFVVATPTAEDSAVMRDVVRALAALGPDVLAVRVP